MATTKRQRAPLNLTELGAARKPKAARRRAALDRRRARFGPAHSRPMTKWAAIAAARKPASRAAATPRKQMARNRRAHFSE